MPHHGKFHVTCELDCWTAVIVRYVLRTGGTVFYLYLDEKNAKTPMWCVPVPLFRNIEDTRN